MHIYDKDKNFLTKLSTGIGLQLRIGSMLEIDNTIYVVENMIMDNSRDQYITYVDTLLNYKLKGHVLQFTYDYYTPEEIQFYLDNIGLEIRLKDDIDYSKDTRMIKVNR